MVTKIILVRHCRSMGNMENRFQGWTDSEISDVGRQQLERLAQRFQDEKIDVAYSSPLKRAFQTAEAATRFSHIPIQTLEGLKEVHAGEIENMTLQEISQGFPAVSKAWNETPHLCEFPGGETMAEFFERISRTFEEIVEANVGKTVLVVTHGCALVNLCAYIRSGSVRSVGEEEVFDNTSVTVVEIEEDGTKKLILRNDVSHLSPELQKKPHYVFEVAEDK